MQLSLSCSSKAQVLTSVEPESEKFAGDTRRGLWEILERKGGFCRWGRYSSVNGGFFVVAMLDYQRVSGIFALKVVKNL
jgi:hypothetical protein